MTDDDEPTIFRAECGAEFRIQVAARVHEITCHRCAGFPRGLARRACAAIDSRLYDGVEIACFNRAEADEVIALLPERIRDRVRVTWMEFGPQVSK